MERGATSAVLGDVRLDLLDEGRFRLDGGAMFRVVPKVLWEREAPADALNRIELAMRPLLIRWRERVILVESGIGPGRRDPGFLERCAVEPGPGIEAGLAALGLAAEDVDTVVLSHLHFDHGGGLVHPDGRLRFPAAQVVVQAGELADAGEDCPLCRASYVASDVAPLAAAGRLRPVEGETELAPGIRVVVTGGHTRRHQIVEVEAGGQRAVFWGDLVPMAAHLRPHYVLGYDLYPRQSWEEKARRVPRAVEEGWLQVFYHDPRTPFGRVAPDGKGFRVEPLAG